MSSLAGKRKHPTPATEIEHKSAKIAKGGEEKESTARDEIVIQNFRDFVKINTISSVGPTGTYRKAINLLKGIAEKAHFETEVVEFAPEKPILIVTWKGENPELSSILCNSHYDVVPVDVAKWNYDPFAADVSKNCVFGRGTQDMKCVGIQHLEALIRLKDEGVKLKRTVHVSYVPDEEIGGVDGLGSLVKQTDFMAKLNIGFAIDEGLASPTDTFTVFYGERAPFWGIIKCTGPAGHGSRFVEDTATHKATRCLNKLFQYRDAEEAKVKNGAQIGEVNTINVTVFQSGRQLDNGKYTLNVIPTEAVIGFDARLTPLRPHKEFLDFMDECTKEEGVSYNFQVSTPESKPTSIDENNKWWKTFRDSLVGQGLDIETKIFPAATDSRYLRESGLPALGFSPMNNTPILLHDHDEFLDLDVFLRGVKIFKKLISDVANCS